MEKQNRLFVYTEEQINQMLLILGELPARTVLKVINSLYTPVKIENVNAETKEEKAAE